MRTRQLISKVRFPYQFTREASKFGRLRKNDIFFIGGEVGDVGSRSSDLMNCETRGALSRAAAIP
jgi:hypothetical protein